MTPAERSVLSALLNTAGGCLHEISLTGKDFSTPGGELVYTLIQDAVEAGEPADQVTVVNRLIKTGERSITPAQVWELTDIYVPAGAVVHHAGIVAEAAARRRFITTATALTQRAQEGTDLDTLANDSEALTTATTGMGAVLRSVSDTIDDTLDSLEDRPTYIQTPWDGVNRFMQGWRPSALHIVGARPSVGKTVVGLQAALSLCNLGPVAYTSLEMDSQELELRMVSQEAGIDMGRIQRRQLANDDWERVAKARDRWKRLPLFIDPSSDPTLAQVSRHAWSVKRQHGLAAVVVDYLQLMESTDPAKSEYEVVSKHSRRLKQLSKALGVPVIVLSQLNRASEHREGKAPQLSDLRSSGSIEQDADVVLLIHRDINNTPWDVQLIVAKNRNGPTGSTDMEFVGHLSHIRERRWTPAGAAA